MLSLWELQVMTVATSCVGMPPQHKQKGLPGERVGGHKLFPLPSPSGLEGCGNGTQHLLQAQQNDSLLRR